MNTILCTKTKKPITGCHAHSHSSWEIIMQLNGKVTSLIGNKTYILTPGDIVIVPPGILHDGKSDSCYEDMYLQVHNLDFYDVIFVHDCDNNILTLMNLLHKTLLEEEPYFTQIADAVTETICLCIKKLSMVNIRYPFVNRLRNTIYNNLSNQNFSLSKEIKESGYNKDYLRRRFKAVTQRTPLEYLTFLRLKQAKSFLLQDNFISIDDVAKKCGFKDSFYFSTCFKNNIGISPLKYRKNNLIIMGRDVP